MKGLTVLVAGLTAAAVSYFLYLKSKKDQVSATTVSSPAGVQASPTGAVSTAGMQSPTSQLQGGAQASKADTQYVISSVSALSPNRSYSNLLLPQTARFQRLS
jgi:hypothetical protein